MGHELDKSNMKRRY